MRERENRKVITPQTPDIYDLIESTENSQILHLRDEKETKSKEK